MTLNSSGPISFGGSTTGQSINLELGVSATALASINSTSFRTLAGVASGQISLSNFYGKSNASYWMSKLDYPALSLSINISGSNIYWFSVDNGANTLGITTVIPVAGGSSIAMKNITQSTNNWGFPITDYKTNKAAMYSSNTGNAYSSFGAVNTYSNIGITAFNPSTGALVAQKNSQGTATPAGVLQHPTSNSFYVFCNFITGIYCCTIYPYAVKFDSTLSTINYVLQGNNYVSGLVRDATVSTDGTLWWTNNGSNQFGKITSTTATLYGLNYAQNGCCLNYLKTNTNYILYGFVDNNAHAGYAIIDVSTGTPTRNYQTSISSTGLNNQVISDSSGNIYLISFVSTSIGLYICKFNSSNVLQWARQFTVTGLSLAEYWLATDTNGTNLIITCNIGSSYYPIILNLPTDGSKTGSYSVGGNTLVYQTASITQITPTTYITITGGSTSVTSYSTTATATKSYTTTTRSQTITTVAI
jgi:hypothetical protein